MYYAVIYIWLVLELNNTLVTLILVLFTNSTEDTSYDYDDVDNKANGGEYYRYKVTLFDVLERVYDIKVQVMAAVYEQYVLWVMFYTSHMKSG